MRRERQQLPLAQCEAILQSATSGTLNLIGDDGYPYGVPMSHTYRDGRLYFHCALTGHKVDALRRCPKASFTVVDHDEVVEAHFTTRYRSIIAFGHVRIIDDDAAKRPILWDIIHHFSPTVDHAAQEEEIAQGIARCLVLEFTIDHITGKEGLEFLKERLAHQ